DYPVDVLPEVEIWVLKSGSASPVTPGLPMTYSLTVHNDGPSDAENVLVTDTLPSEVAFDDADPYPNVSDVNPLVWNLGTLTPGTNREIIITVTVDAGVTAGFTNTVVITTSTPGDDPDNNEDDYPVDVLPEVEIWVLKSGSASPVTPGEVMTYSLTVHNDGPSDAADVIVTDTLPAEVAFDSADPYPNVSDVNPLVWNLGTLTPGESRYILITVTVNADVTASFTNTVVITTSTPGDDPGDNEDDHPADATPRADLGIVKSGDPDPVTLGALLTYTLRVTNYGPGAAENVRVTDTLPAEVAYVGAQPAHTYTPPDTVVWALGALSPGETRDLTLTVRVHTWATQTFTNVATLGSDTPDDDPDNDEDDEPTTPLAPGIDVIKTVTPSVAVPNAPFTYTIRVANVGQVALDPLMLTDTLPPDFNYVVGSGIPVDPDVVAEPLLTWLDLGRLAPGDSLTVSFAVTATPGITGIHVNLVTATGDTPGGPITDTDDVPITIDEPALRVDKRLVGWDRERDVLTFTIAISNVGPVTLDVIPLMDDYDYQFLACKHATPAPDEVIPNPGLLRWHDLTESPGGFGQNLPPGAQFEVTTVFSVVADITRTVNTASVTGARDVDDNPANDDEDEEIVINIPTAIALRYLRAARREDGILLEWAMLMERDIYAFELHRAAQDQFDQARQTGFQASRGSGAEYAYLDKDVGLEPRYWYWVTALDNEAGRTRYGPVSVTGAMDAQWERVYLPLILRQSQ
ncbi:MAG TPA: DUF11 domain-containing protein, partial [Chloroflexi bacterium]|nr:DUF11 domain-containing protein [Chloroflexota bacterium]